MNTTIVCADWGKEPVKRSAWERRAGSGVVRPVALPGVLSFENLVDYCAGLGSSVLLGIDAAIGVPRHVVQRYREGEGPPDAGFLHWARWLFRNGRPYDPCTTPEAWHYGCPFIHIPKGKGARSAFPNQGIELHRRIEQDLGANSPLIVSGLPGTVGSGSRALWHEMVECMDKDPTLAEAIWPFSGNLSKMLGTRQTTIAEIYPKACYGLALAQHLPARLTTIAKTRAPARAESIARLQRVLDGELLVEDLDRCYDSEDDFDAMISVVALHRLLGSPLAYAESQFRDNVEGDILGRWAIGPGKGESIVGKAPSSRKAARRNDPGIPDTANEANADLAIGQRIPWDGSRQPFHCPIPGCTKVFRSGRSGWDAHVASWRNHPDWHPAERDTARRKSLFRLEFPGFFENGSH